MKTIPVEDIKVTIWYCTLQNQQSKTPSKPFNKLCTTISSANFGSLILTNEITFYHVIALISFNF